jgi:hypothetical protein
VDPTTGKISTWTVDAIPIVNCRVTDLNRSAVLDLPNAPIKTTPGGSCAADDGDGTERARAAALAALSPDKFKNIQLAFKGLSVSGHAEQHEYVFAADSANVEGMTLPEAGGVIVNDSCAIVTTASHWLQ